MQSDTFLNLFAGIGARTRDHTPQERQVRGPRLLAELVSYVHIVYFILHVCMDMAAAEDGTWDVPAYRRDSRCLTPQTHRVETQYSRTARLAHVSNILTGADPQ